MMHSSTGLVSCRQVVISVASRPMAAATSASPASRSACDNTWFISLTFIKYPFKTDLIQVFLCAHHPFNAAWVASHDRLSVTTALPEQLSNRFSLTYPHLHQQPAGGTQAGQGRGDQQAVDIQPVRTAIQRPARIEVTHLRI